MLGIIFAIENISPLFKFQTYLPFIASFICLTQEYMFNDWAGFTEDFKDPAKQNRFIFKIGRNNALKISIALIIIYLCLMWYLKLFVIGIALVFLSTVYSHPLTNIKTKPFLPYILFYVFILLFFASGYMRFSDSWKDVLSFSLFFGLIIIAGQINQELRDYETDSENGVFTTVQLLPKRYFFIVQNILFLLSIFVFYSIFKRGFISCYMLFIYTVFIVFFIFYSSFRGFKDRLSSNFFSYNKKFYQIMYFIVGLVLLYDRILIIS